MKTVFADSSFYVALLNPNDKNHDRAVFLVRELRSVVVLTDYIILELGGAFSNRRLRHLFVELIENLRTDPDVKIIPASASLLDEGILLFLQRSDKDWSLTDCISMNVMRDLGIRDVLSEDHHFKQAGFNPLLTEL